MSRRGVAVDVDLPAGQPRSQPRVLPFLADRERKLIFIHRNLDALFFRIEHEVFHFRRFERLENELLRVGAPPDNVDFLVVQFADDIFHPRAAHTDTGADRIDLFVRAGDRDLGPVTRFAGDPANLDGSVVNLADFELKEAPDEIRMAAGNDDLRPANSVLDRDHVGAQPIANIVIFNDDALALRHNGFKFSKIKNDVRTIEAADRPADDFAGPVLELFVNHFLLDLADALHHRLLGRLGRDPSEVLGGDFDLYFAAHRCVRINPLRLG